MYNARHIRATTTPSQPMILSALRDPFSIAVAALVGLVFAALGVVFLIVWINELRQARATRSWPQVTGRVLHARVVKSSFSNRSRGRLVDSTVYDPLVEYEYAVSGVRYQGRRIAVGIGYSRTDRKAVERQVAPYQAGADVPVFYDPADPSRAVLEHRLAGGPLFLVLGLLVFLILLVMFVPWGSLL